MTSSPGEKEKFSKHPLGIINNLLLKILKAPNLQSLMFIITNDTHSLIKYDRAILWNLKGSELKMTGISGNISVNPYSELHRKITQIANAIKEKEKSQIIKEDNLDEYQEEWRDFREKYDATVLWLPIFSSESQVLGLWLERWDVVREEEPDPNTLDLLNHFLLPAYGAAWENKQKGLKIQKVKSHPHTSYWLAALTAFIVLIFFIRLPLSISVPCEVVPKDPYLVTAPLEGVVEEVVVDPGDEVRKGDLLFVYDKRIPLRELEVASEEVELAKAELDRSRTLGIKDPDSLEGVSILELKLEKALASLSFHQYRSDLLTVEASIDGIIQMDDPDEWRGKPVQVGEKVLKIIDVNSTKVRMWVPQDDHVKINTDIPAKIFLNVDPASSYQGIITFISNETVVTENNVVSFMVEADWENPDTKLWPGLKGTAVLYGDKVSLFYFLIRKPWSFVRRTLGV